MDSASLQSLLKRLCNVMWAANVTNPITYVTQISYLLFLKMLEGMEAEQAAIVAPSRSVRDGKPPAKAGTTNGKRQPTFAKAKAGDETVDFARLRWSVLTSDPDNDRMLRTLRDLLPKLALHPALSPAARALFEDSAIVIPDGATLRRAADIIAPVHFLSEDKWDEVQLDCILEKPPFSGAGLAPKRSLRVEKGEKYVLFLAAALRSLRPGGRGGIVLPNGILFGDTTAHLEVKKRLLAEFDLQAVVTLPKGMFEPYTPNPTCFLIFQKTGKPTKETWFYRVEGDGSPLKKARKFGPQFRNDFPDLLAKWPKRKTEEGRAWRVPAAKIIANGYNLTLASLGLVEPEMTEHAEPEDILTSVAVKEQRILEIVEEMRRLVAEEAR